MPMTSKTNKNNANLQKNRNFITNYFKSTQPSSSTQIINCGFENRYNAVHTPDFYESCLNKRIDLCSSEKNCHSKKQQLQKQLEVLIQKEGQIQKATSSCLGMCEKKNRKIQILQSQIEQQNKNKKNVSHVDVHKILFDSYKGDLTEIQLSTLRSLDKNARGDSTFVKNCMSYFYSKDLTKLQHKSLTGRSKTNHKEPVTPQKLNQIKSLYIERLNDIQLPDADRIIRERKFNRHINFAIANINAVLKNQSDKKKTINVDNIK